MDYYMDGEEEFGKTEEGQVNHHSKLIRKKGDNSELQFLSYVKKCNNW